jgi:integrase
LYYDLKSVNVGKSDIVNDKREKISTKKGGLTLKNASWVPAYTIQELMGHSDVRITMIYTHTIKSKTKKEAGSPLDF